MQQLLAELLPREESYENRFKSGGAGEIRHRGEGLLALYVHRYLYILFFKERNISLFF